MTHSDKTERAKVVYLRVHVLNHEWQEVRIGVGLELYIRREGEVGGSAAKFRRDGLVIPACGGRKRIRPVDGKVGHAWDDKGKGDSKAAKEMQVRHNRICVEHKKWGKHIHSAERKDEKHDRATGEPFAAE